MKKSSYNGIATYLSSFNIPTEKPNYQQMNDVIKVIQKFLDQPHVNFDGKSNAFDFIQDNFGHFVVFVKSNYNKK